MSTMASASLNNCRACSTTFSPSGVSITERLVRSATGAVRISSRSLMPELKVDWVTKQASAAAPKCM